MDMEHRIRRGVRHVAFALAEPDTKGGMSSGAVSLASQDSPAALSGFVLPLCIEYSTCF